MKPISFYDYNHRRDWKLKNYEAVTADLVVELKDPHSLSKTERDALRQRIEAANMVIYAFPQPTGFGKNELKSLARQLGLLTIDCNLCAEDDGITYLHSSDSKTPNDSGRYIPYSSRPLNWHTDGYYNTTEQQIGAFIIHCCNAAVAGGESRLLDHEILYMLMRERNRQWTDALGNEEVMAIPANIVDGKEIRPLRSGPVFYRHSQTQALQMRYTARARHVIWQQSDAVTQARKFISELLASDSPYIIQHRLQPGQGIICNNVLHSRGAYQDDAENRQSRLVMRARYYERVAMQ